MRISSAHLNWRHFRSLWIEARSILFQGNWDSRDQKAVDKILGQNFGVDISSRELCQDAILMMSSYRQNCLWPGLETETTTPAFHSRLRRSFKKKNTRNTGYNMKNQYQLTHGPQKHTRNGSLQKVHTGLKAKQKSLKRGFYDSMRSWFSKHTQKGILQCALKELLKENQKLQFQGITGVLRIG